MVIELCSPSGTAWHILHDKHRVENCVEVGYWTPVFHKTPYLFAVAQPLQYVDRP